VGEVILVLEEHIKKLQELEDNYKKTRALIESDIEEALSIDNSSFSLQQLYWSELVKPKQICKWLGITQWQLLAQIKQKITRTCSKCCNDFDVVIQSKSQAKLGITDICPSCREKEDKKLAQERAFEEEKYEEKQNIEREKNTTIYIERYLDPEKSWVNDCPPRERWNSVASYGRAIDEERVAEAIKSLSYSEFLSTPYWIAVSQRAKFKAGYKCALCHTNKQTLMTHHTTYEHHGYEHRYLEDLIVLCGQCHGKHHNKLPEL
jgi:5-methylcytosine-specific restriction endonuclease McrA